VQDEVKGCRARADGDRILGFMKMGERLFEFPNAIAHRDPTALNDRG
jgi:hypothetical protein